MVKSQTIITSLTAHLIWTKAFILVKEGSGKVGHWDVERGYRTQVCQAHKPSFSSDALLPCATPRFHNWNDMYRRNPKYRINGPKKYGQISILTCTHKWAFVDASTPPTPPHTPQSGEWNERWHSQLLQERNHMGKSISSLGFLEEKTRETQALRSGVAWETKTKAVNMVILYHSLSQIWSCSFLTRLLY